MSRISLAFTPNCSFDERRLVGTAGARHLESFGVIVPKMMLHRRIYMLHTITAGTFVCNGKLNFYLAGSLVFSMKYVNTNGNNAEMCFIGNMSGVAPVTIDMLRVQLNNTAFTLAPYNAIIACDKIQFEGSTTNSAAGVPIQYMGVFSQNYW